LSAFILVESKLKLGVIITWNGGAHWTVPELFFEKKGLILVVQQLWLSNEES